MVRSAWAVPSVCATDRAAANGESQQPYDGHRAVLERWDHDEAFPRGQAIEFMRQTIHDNPGAVVLLAIGCAG